METIVVEPAIELPSALPGAARLRVHGRLILTEAALYFIHGWDEQDRRGLWWTFEREVFAEGSDAHAGERMLAQYAGLAPQRQAEIVPSSRALPFAELSSARLVGWRSRLIVETRRHGDTLVYRIPRAQREEVVGWLAKRSAFASAAP